MNAEHVGIYANDSIGLCRWYKEKLGMTVVRTLEKEGRPPVFFLKGEEGLVIEILPTDSAQPSRKLSDPGYSHIGVVVDDFDRVASSLRSLGVSVADVRKTSNGWTIGYFDDPEGNRLEIVHRP